MTPNEFIDEFRRLSESLEQSLKYLRGQATELADAEQAYRASKAQAWLAAPTGTVPEREAWVNGHTAAERRRRDLADGMRQAALEAVRSRRTQISALQSVIAAFRAEAEFARTGPEMAA